MRCPSCGAMETRVLETRTAGDGRVIRRRRECPDCSYRFTTYEKAEEKRTLRVKDGSRETFARTRLFGASAPMKTRLAGPDREFAAKIEDGLVPRHMRFPCPRSAGGLWTAEINRCLRFASVTGLTDLQLSAGDSFCRRKDASKTETAIRFKCL